MQCSTAKEAASTPARSFSTSLVSAFNLKTLCRSVIAIALTSPQSARPSLKRLSATTPAMPTASRWESCHGALARHSTSLSNESVEAKACGLSRVNCAVQLSLVCNEAYRSVCYSDLACRFDHVFPGECTRPGHDHVDVGASWPRGDIIRVVRAVSWSVMRSQRPHVQSSRGCRRRCHMRVNYIYVGRGSSLKFFVAPKYITTSASQSSTRRSGRDPCQATSVF